MDHFEAILDDMAQRVDDEDGAEKPALFAHFEDEEAFQFFDALFPGLKRGGVGRKLGVRIIPIPLGIGGSHLVGLPKRDPIFRNRLLVVDADTRVPTAVASQGNVVKLSRAKGTVGTARSPENTIRLFLWSVTKAVEGPLYEALLKFKTTNPTTDKVDAAFFANGVGQSGERDKAKSWWTSHWKILKKWRVIEGWASLHAEEVDAFRKSLETAIRTVAARINPKLSRTDHPS